MAGVIAYALWRRSREPDEAADYLGIAVTLDPTDGSAVAMLGAALLALGQPTEAAVEYQRALELAPSRHDLHVQLARCYLDMGDTDKAKAHCRLAREHGVPIPGELQQRLE